MCGIGGATRPLSDEEIEGLATALQHRGPDASAAVRTGDSTLVHTRLSIVDLDARSNQPFRFGPVTVAYNGETWNWRELREELREWGCQFETEGDTEVVAAALATWGEDALPKLQGMFAIAWTREGRRGVRLARDAHGEVPLHVAMLRDGHWAFASELKALGALGAARGEGWVAPGSVVTLAGRERPRTRAWYAPRLPPVRMELDEAAARLRELLDVGARERAMADVPVCAILSGGLDSSAFVYHLRQHVPDLVTYIAVLEGHRSADLRHAEEVAEALGVELRVVTVRSPTTADLRDVIRIIEQPFKAQVEIGWPSVCLARAMAADGFKVTYSGEGADELYASYQFALRALATGEDWFAYRRKLFASQARKNFPRANKAWMNAGVEVRLPYLHVPLTEFVLSLPREAVQGHGKPKLVAQEAYRGLLPDGVVNRQKAAFQDAMHLKPVIESTIADPKRFYGAEYQRTYG